MAKTYYDSPFLEAGYVWIGRPDTKFNAEGVFKAPLIGDLSDPAVQAFKAKIDAEAEAARLRVIEEKGMTPGEAKKVKLYVPYTLLEDDNGDPTGRIRFDFKQNAKLRLKDGTVKEVKIAVWDSTGKKAVTRPVMSGSVLRVRYAFRDIFMASTKEAGTRLDFAMVQVKKLAEGGGGSGFGAVEDGYVADEIDEDGVDQTSGGNAAGNSEDY